MKKSPYTFIGFLAVVIVAGLVWMFMNRQATVVPQEKNAEIPKPEITVKAPTMVAAVGANSLKLSTRFSESSLIIDTVVLDKPGFVVLRDDLFGKPGVVVGASALLSQGESKNVPVVFSAILNGGQKYYAMVYSDNGDRVFDQRTDTLISENNTVLSIPFDLEGKDATPTDLALPQAP